QIAHRRQGHRRLSRAARWHRAGTGWRRTAGERLLQCKSLGVAVTFPTRQLIPFHGNRDLVGTSTWAPRFAWIQAVNRRFFGAATRGNQDDLTRRAPPRVAVTLLTPPPWP